MADRVHILVLNHNGRSLLNECLPSVVTCARTAERLCRVTVIDNDSADDSVAWLERYWPEVGVFRSPNRGLVSFNGAVRFVNEPIVMLLNNDVKLAMGCVDHLAAAFGRYDDCFLAGPLCLSFDGHYEGTLSNLCFRRGLVHTRLSEPGLQVECRARFPRAGIRRAYHAAMPCAASERVMSTGGASDATATVDEEGDTAERFARYTASVGAVLAVSRERFLALGGFDSLFLPGRYEDLDLAFRGWLVGWKAYFVPEALAYHKGSATFEACLASRQLHELDIRNSLLFAWKNLREPRHIGLHLAFLATRVLRAVATGQRTFLAGLAGAIAKLPDALQSRRAAASPRLRSERELFDLLGTRSSAVLVGSSTRRL